MKQTTEEFFNDLIAFYKDAPVCKHTNELMIRNIEELRKREVKLNNNIEKLKQQIEQDDDFHYSQFNFARADAEYYKEAYKRAEEQLKSINFNCERMNRIDKANKGLRQQCRQLKTENERLKEEVGYPVFADGCDENGKEVHKQIFKTYKDACQELVEQRTKLQKQLKEKDEDIKQLKEYYRLAKVEQDYWVNDFNKRLENNTKQVCKKIMNRAKTANALQSVRDGTISLTTLKHILDQIE